MGGGGLPPRAGCGLGWLGRGAGLRCLPLPLPHWGLCPCGAQWTRRAAGAPGLSGRGEGAVMGLSEDGVVLPACPSPRTWARFCSLVS